MAYRPVPPPAPVRAWLDAGLAAHRAGELERAAASYRQALALAPQKPDAPKLPGNPPPHTRPPSPARAAALDRNNARLLANLGHCRIALGQYDAAYDAFRKAARAEPGELQF